MTIQRLYNLPNCRLVLEGLSGNGSIGQGEPRPVLSVLMSAECHFQGQGEPLTGGREFFEGLVRAVSSYAQEFLSGVPSQLNHNGQAGSVRLRKIHGDLHRLTFADNSLSTAPETERERHGDTETRRHGEGVVTASPRHRVSDFEGARRKDIDLTTVQLFDLVEAVDQFFADSLTLPDLSLNLKPVSKREVTSTEPIAKRALPAGIGASGLALAAIAFFFVPIPEVRRRAEPALETGGRESVASSLSSNGEEPLVEPSPGAAEGLFSSEVPPADGNVPVAEGQGLEESLVTAPKIAEPEKVEELRAGLFARINDAWTQPISSNLIYRVQVAADGAMVGYKPVSPEAAELVSRTSLPGLLYKSADGGVSKEPVAEFKVEFMSDGVLRVNPW